MTTFSCFSIIFLKYCSSVLKHVKTLYFWSSTFWLHGERPRQMQRFWVELDCFKVYSISSTCCCRLNQALDNLPQTYSVGLLRAPGKIWSSDLEDVSTTQLRFSQCREPQREDIWGGRGKFSTPWMGRVWHARPFEPQVSLHCSPLNVHGRGRKNDKCTFSHTLHSLT